MAKLLATGISGAPHLEAFDTLARERLAALEIERALVYLIDNVPADVLPILAEQFDVLGFKGWGLIGKKYGPVFEDVLEGVTSAVAAYGIRRLNPAYTGPVVRLRRIDNAEQDFTPMPEGGLDVEDIRKWLNTDQGWLVTLYDQIGNNDFTAASAGAQPRFVLERMAGRPAIVFNGTDHKLTATAPSLSDFEFSAVSTQLADDPASGVLADLGAGGAAGFAIRRNGSTEQYAASVLGNVITTPEPNGVPVLLTLLRDATTAQLFKNNKPAGSSSVPADEIAGNIALGNSVAGGEAGSKELTEFIIWDEVLDERGRGRVANRMMQYYGLAEPIIDVPDTAAIDRQRRDLLKRALEMHRYKGTPYAVKEAIRSVGFRDAQVIEKVGLKYNGSVNYDGYQTYGSGFPFNFRIVFDLGSQQGITAERLADLAALIDEYKNVRSRLVNIAFEATLEERVFAADNLELTVDIVSIGESALRELRYDGANTYGGSIQHDSTTDSVGTSIL